MSVTARATKSFYEMTDGEFAAALRTIITTSQSENEVRRRLIAELNYPYSIAITSHQPQSAAGREASDLVRQLGGLHLGSGAMAMAMAHAPSGKTLSL